MVKRLHTNQKKDLDSAIKAIIENPAIGQTKVGDLAGVCVYKFRMVNQLALLAYCYDKAKLTLTLLTFGSHKNFYRDIKNII